MLLDVLVLLLPQTSQDRDLRAKVEGKCYKYINIYYTKI